MAKLGKADGGAPSDCLGAIEIVITGNKEELLAGPLSEGGEGSTKAVDGGLSS